VYIVLLPPADNPVAVNKYIISNSVLAASALSLLAAQAYFVLGAPLKSRDSHVTDDATSSTAYVQRTGTEPSDVERYATEAC
jgi:hypothetical protein